MIYIPAYWWYSLDYSSNTTICTFKYRTYMNVVAILPKLAMRLLQSQNVKRKVAPIIDKDKQVELQEEVVNDSDKKEN